MFWITRKTKHALVTVSNALADGFGVGAGCGIFLVFPLELWTKECVTTAICGRTAIVVELSRLPLLEAENAVPPIVECSGQGACCCSGMAGEPAGGIECVRQFGWGAEVAKGEGEDGHDTDCGGEDVATDQRRERRQGDRDGDTVMVAAAGASFILYINGCLKTR